MKNEKKLQITFFIIFIAPMFLINISYNHISKQCKYYFPDAKMANIRTICALISLFGIIGFFKNWNNKES